MVFYTSVEITSHICSIPTFLPHSLKGKGKSTLAYMQHIFINQKLVSEKESKYVGVLRAFLVIKILSANVWLMWNMNYKEGIAF